MPRRTRYTIALPDQKRLKIARIKIEAILKQHDLAGVVILHTPGMAEFFYDIQPSYSRLSVDEKAGSVVFRSRIEADHLGDKDEQLHDQACTANMTAAIADNLRHAASMFTSVDRYVTKAAGAIHTEGAHIPDPAESNLQ